MQNSDIACLKRAMRNCIHNATLLLWGSDTSFPNRDDISKAQILIDTAFSIDARIESLQKKEGVANV